MSDLVTIHIPTILVVFEAENSISTRTMITPPAVGSQVIYGPRPSIGLVVMQVWDITGQSTICTLKIKELGSANKEKQDQETGRPGRSQESPT